MKMTWKNPKADILFFYNPPLLILTKQWGETFHFHRFKDEKFLEYLHSPYNSRRNTVPEFVLPVLNAPMSAL